MVNSSLTKFCIQDLIPGSTKTSGKKVDVDAILPYLIVPGLLLIGSISRTITITVMVVIAMGALYVHSRPRQKNRSPFFFSWTISSGLYMFLVFENGILCFLEITMLENSIFLLLFLCTLYFFYKMKSIAEYELTGTGTKGKEYRWDCCVLRPNYLHFLAGHTFALATLLLGTNLGLTTVCQPFIFYGAILMPFDCDDIYYDFKMAICFVTSIYALGYALVVALVLIRQLIVYLPKYS
ncbi:hypothetical protein HW555_007686, partial [Spodoptera exigua]